MKRLLLPFVLLLGSASAFAIEPVKHAAANGAGCNVRLETSAAPDEVRAEAESAGAAAPSAKPAPSPAKASHHATPRLVHPRWHSFIPGMFK